MRVLFAGGGTGGHLYPALAIARAIVAIDSTVSPFFIGARRGIERDILPTTEFPHALLELHPFYRARLWENWRTLTGALGAWRHIGRIADERRPSVVVGTGGYAAGVALAWAAAHRIPLAVQEQNSFPGQTVRIASRWAREIYVGFPEAIERLPAVARPHAIDTGNPIAPPPSPRRDRTTARAAWGFPSDVPVLLIFGGSQGSAALNSVVDAWVARGVPEGLRVIWATGKAHFDKHRARESERVHVRAYLAPIADAYAASDLALTRAGAMTTAELAAWGIPQILVPLPTAAADHQTANARALAAAGAARWIPQSELDAPRLDETIRELISHPDMLEALSAGARSRARPEAAATIARRVLEMARTAQQSAEG